jgi:DNA polymerase-3 subunit alpha
MSEFTHLHLHSQYSLLDGAIRIDDLPEYVRQQNMHAVAVTDHGNMYGALHFYKKAKQHNIKPILGCEAYVATRGRFDRTARESSHLVLLSKTNEGYKNLSYLISKGFTEGFYYHPRIDESLLKTHSKGLIGLSACLGGVVNKCFFHSGMDAAIATAKRFAALFAPGDFYLEIQSNGLPEQQKANEVCIEIARHTGIPLIATADSHYLRPEDSAAHEMLMCIGLGKSLADFRADGTHSDLLYVRSPQEMWESLGHLAPDALENTQKITRECDVSLDLNQTYLPNYGVPAQYTRESYLEYLAFQGLKARAEQHQGKLDLPTYRARLEYELNIINRMGFAGYFLIVWDFIRFAKESQIPVGPGRGSGAGSLVAYCLRITDLDPIPYDLLFERFLNPERVSMPDFDIDFCQDRRNEVIDYVAQKYGADNVGQIITYSQLSAKSVIKDVGRVMALPFAEVNSLTKLIPNLIHGKKVTIEQALALEPKLRQIQAEKPIYAEVIRLAQALEGLNRQTGTHAAGLVIADSALWNYVPVRSGKNGELITQFAKDEVEEIGLVKFDFLGLKTLTVIAKAILHIRSAQCPTHAQFNIENIHLTDSSVYKMLSQGNTDGVFQLESSGFKELLKRLKPDCFEDIIAAVALYRPGPLDAGMVDDYIARKHGKKTVVYPHPVCEHILNNTYGVIVYQEQVMRIAVDLCGFTMAEADILRKAMGKKKADVMQQMKEKFVHGAKQHNQMPADAAEDLFHQIEKFAGYAFNKSHSAAYALISYQTAYLKAHFPVEFMAALLSTEIGNQDAVVRYIQSAREKNIVILPPCIQKSQRDFSVVREKNQAAILFGLGAVKGIGDAAIDEIVARRQQATPKNLFDLCAHVDSQKVGKKALIALIKSGSMDFFHEPREQLLHQVEEAVAYGNKMKKDRDQGQASLFDFLPEASRLKIQTTTQSSKDTPQTTKAATWDKRTRLAYEKEALGFYITGHPLDDYRHNLKRLANSNTLQIMLGEKKDNDTITIGGIFSRVKERPLKDGSGRMAFATLEDLHGSCEVLIFSRVFAQAEALIKGDSPVLVQGKVFSEYDFSQNNASTEDKDEQATLKIRAEHIELLAEAQLKNTQSITLSLTEADLNSKKIAQLAECLTRFRGPIPVYLQLKIPKQFTVDIEVGNRFRVHCEEALMVGLKDLFGEQAVQWNR